MEKNIKEYIGDKVWYDGAGQLIFHETAHGDNTLLDVRGWGAIQNLFENEKDALEFQDSLGKWIADAINKKLGEYKNESM